MFETPITVVGTIVNDPIRRQIGDREVYKFRVASNARRRTAEGSWEAGESLFVAVTCWGQRLVTGAGAALGKGSAVIVVGTVSLREYTDRDGNPRSSVEVRAHSVGVDLSRSLVRVEARIPADAAPGADWSPGRDGAGPDAASDDSPPSRDDAGEADATGRVDAPPPGSAALAVSA